MEDSVTCLTTEQFFVVAKKMRPVHVDTKDNAANLFTRTLGKQDFTRLRSTVMNKEDTDLCG